MSSLSSLRGCPCLGCEDLSKCGPGSGPSPITCLLLERWIEGGTKIPERPRIESVNGWFQCPYCPKSLPTERGLKIHVSRVHNVKLATR